MSTNSQHMQILNSFQFLASQLGFSRTLLKLCFISITSFCLSCENNNANKVPIGDTTASAKDTTTKTVRTGNAPNGAKLSQTSDDLYVYYLTNTGDDSQLAKLLRSNSSERIVIQFHREAAGIIGLIAYPGQGAGLVRPRNLPFNLNDTVLLTKGSNSGKSLVDRDVYLGNLEIGHRDVNKLRQWLRSHTADNAYIMFYPELSTISGGNLTYLSYTVQPSNDDTRTEVDNSKLLLTLQVNPSPPRPTSINEQ